MARVEGRINWLEDQIKKVQKLVDEDQISATSGDKSFSAQLASDSHKSLLANFKTELELEKAKSQ
jgi:hypothetical protein